MIAAEIEFFLMLAVNAFDADAIFGKIRVLR
jgi:hypothetical protein